MRAGDLTAAVGWVALGLVAAMAPHPVQAQPTVSASPGVVGRLRVLVDTPSARDAIARVTLAEAAGQGDSGLAGVVYTILNRLASGVWGDSVDQVVNARGQFEPVMRAGGDWRGLPAAGRAQRARIDTILNLALEGRLPDLTGGALYFQNPRIVAERAAAGTVSPGLVHFGGAAPSAVIGDHAFYPRMAGGTGRAISPSDQAGRTIFVPAGGRGGEGASPEVVAKAVGARGLFVLADGRIVEARP
ncbi:Cell Wall Hydrolase [Caulobacter sp. AP07]|uniref:cell wall hydrolase n=1 Tax=Caulobacter sp. AP07 TaxID=1144304 RepID=UPI000271E335|nr:cell wall hydrolase [Caulobacter sp. AP07]EJL38466.1 Cell Wall Hydrolase [Caulobacter sp. AP07]